MFSTDLLKFLIEALFLIIGLVLWNNNLLLLGSLIGIRNVATGSVLYPLSELPGLLEQYSAQRASYKRLYNIINNIKSKEIPSTNLDLNYLDLNYNINNIRLEEIKYKYPKNTDYTIEDLDLSFEKNKIYYIKGSGGSGKTTLINILLGNLNIESGKIYIDDKNISYNDYKLISNNFFSYVLQGQNLLFSSIYNNITLGEDIEEKRINAYIDSLGLSNVIDDLDTELSNIDKKLSFGQLKRIEIIRALLKESSYIILDEPFANLDSENSSALANIIKEISKTRGIIIVSHKFQEINGDEKIINIDTGEFYEK